MDMYFLSTSWLKVLRRGSGASEVVLGVFLPGCERRPWPRPKPTGMRMDMAGLLKTAAGSVRYGMYDMFRRGALGGWRGRKD